TNVEQKVKARGRVVKSQRASTSVCGQGVDGRNKSGHYELPCWKSPLWQARPEQPRADPAFCFAALDLHPFARAAEDTQLGALVCPSSQRPALARLGADIRVPLLDVGNVVCRKAGRFGLTVLRGARGRFRCRCLA